MVGSMWAKFEVSATKIVSCRLLTDRLTHTHKHTDMTDYMIVANLRLATIITIVYIILFMCPYSQLEVRKANKREFYGDSFES